MLLLVLLLIYLFLKHWWHSQYDVSEESAREEAGCGGNVDADMDVRSHTLDRIRKKIIRGTTIVGELS